MLESNKFDWISVNAKQQKKENGYYVLYVIIIYFLHDFAQFNCSPLVSSPPPHLMVKKKKEGKVSMHSPLKLSPN